MNLPNIKQIKDVEMSNNPYYQTDVSLCTITSVRFYYEYINFASEKDYSCPFLYMIHKNVKRVLFLQLT